MTKEFSLRSAEEHHENINVTAEDSQRIITALADRISGKDRLRHVVEDGGDVLYTQEGEKFFMVRLNQESKESIAALGQEVKEFNDQFFDPEENDSPEEYETALRNNIYNFYAMRDGGGKLAAILTTQVLEMGTQGETPDIGMLIWWVATKEEYQKKGLSTEMYGAAYHDMARISTERNARIVGFFGETEDEVEGYLNRTFGRKRAYMETEGGNVEEVPYMHPPSVYGNEGVSSHLMGRLLDGRETMDISEYLRLVKSIYAQYTRPEYFEKKEPARRERFMEKVNAIYDGIVQDTKRAKGGTIFFMTKEEREKKRKELEVQGKTLKDAEE